jgi:TRAP transporter TAXI family solute receptor
MDSDALRRLSSSNNHETEETMRIPWLAAATAVAVLLASPAHAQTVSIGTSPQGSSNYALGNALGKVLTDEAGLRARVVPFGGGQQFLPMINNKELELAIPSGSDALFAYQGKQTYEGKPNTNLRAIATVFPYYIGWYVKKDSPYQKLADLKGKKMPIGFTANAAQRTVFLAGFAAEGVKESDFDGVPVAHVVRAADDFMQGKIEASTFAIGSGKMTEVDTKVGGIRWLNMTDTPEAEKRLKEIMPTAYVETLKPAPNLTGILAPTPVIFENYLVLTGSQLSDDAAYKIAKVLYEDREKLAAIAKPWGRYDPAKLTDDRGIPFHPGAIKFYKEKGIWSGK